MRLGVFNSLFSGFQNSIKYFFLKTTGLPSFSQPVFQSHEIFLPRDPMTLGLPGCHFFPSFLNLEELLRCKTKIHFFPHGLLYGPSIIGNAICTTRRWVEHETKKQKIKNINICRCSNKCFMPQVLIFWHNFYVLLAFLTMTQWFL